MSTKNAYRAAALLLIWALASSCTAPKETSPHGPATPDSLWTWDVGDSWTVEVTNFETPQFPGGMWEGTVHTRSYLVESIEVIDRVECCVLLTNRSDKSFSFRLFVGRQHGGLWRVERYETPDGSGPKQELSLQVGNYQDTNWSNSQDEVSDIIRVPEPDEPLDREVWTNGRDSVHQSVRFALEGRNAMIVLSFKSPLSRHVERHLHLWEAGMPWPTISAMALGNGTKFTTFIRERLIDE